MRVYQAALFAVLAAGGGHLYGDIHLTISEINLGGVPLDDYYATNSGGAFLPNCPTTYTVQQCYRLMFNNNPSITDRYTPNNYIAQGVTGVRFQFGLRGGGYSTPWDASGNVQRAWGSNLLAFLSDLHSYGILRVTPTPNLGGWTYWANPGGTVSTDPFTTSSGVGGTGTHQLMYLSWLPYGEIFISSPPPGSQYGFPDCGGYNAGYSTANANPAFWGWTPFFNLVRNVFAQVQASGLQLAEFDICNEVDVTDFTVQGRLIYDSSHAALMCLEPCGAMHRSTVSTPT